MQEVSYKMWLTDLSGNEGLKNVTTNQVKANNIDIRVFHREDSACTE